MRKRSHPFLCIGLALAVLLGMLYCSFNQSDYDKRTLFPTDYTDMATAPMFFEKGSYTFHFTYAYAPDVSLEILRTQTADADNALPAALYAAPLSETGETTLTLTLDSTVYDLQIRYTGETEIDFTTIESASPVWRDTWLLLCLVTLTAGAVLWLFLRDRRRAGLAPNDAGVSEAAVHLLLLSAAVYVTLPVLRDFLVNGHDMAYHPAAHRGHQGRAAGRAVPRARRPHVLGRAGLCLAGIVPRAVSLHPGGAAAVRGLADGGVSGVCVPHQPRNAAYGLPRREAADRQGRRRPDRQPGVRPGRQPYDHIAHARGHRRGAGAGVPPLRNARHGGNAAPGQGVRLADRGHDGADPDACDQRRDRRAVLRAVHGGDACVRENRVARAFAPGRGGGHHRTFEPVVPCAVLSLCAGGPAHVSLCHAHHAPRGVSRTMVCLVRQSLWQRRVPGHHGGDAAVGGAAAGRGHPIVPAQGPGGTTAICARWGMCRLALG